MMAQKVQRDEKVLQADVGKQQSMLKSEQVMAHTSMLEKRAYPDGCVCECKASGCDEENHEGPVCTCPNEAKTSLPPPFEPWPFHQPGAARGGRFQGSQKLMMHPPVQMMQPHARPMAQERARFQQKWVGSPQKMLPPDGDYVRALSTCAACDGHSIVCILRTVVAPPHCSVTILSCSKSLLCIVY
jgi:hypothetical protein